MNNLAIIPARGGSKRIPRKNLRDFFGRPVIAYSIEAALSSGLFSEVMVSTEDEEIAETAIKYGAQVPFLRSVETAGDYATTVDVLAEVIERYNQNGRIFEHIGCIYATAPFVNADKLKKAYKMISDNDWDCVFSTVPFSYPVWRGLQFNQNNAISLVWPEYLNSRSQDLPVVYQDAGQFYLFNAARFSKTGKLWTEHTSALVLSELEVQDLDTETDWKLAEIKFKLLHSDEENLF